MYRELTDRVTIVIAKKCTGEEKTWYEKPGEVKLVDVGRILQDEAAQERLLVADCRETGTMKNTEPLYGEERNVMVDQQTNARSESLHGESGKKLVQT